MEVRRACGRAAGALRLTANDLLRLKIIDAVVPEPLGGAHRDPEGAAQELEAWIARSLRDLKRLKLETIVRRRQERLRSMGSFLESKSAAAEARPTKPSKARSRRSQSASREVTSAQS